MRRGTGRLLLRDERPRSEREGKQQRGGPRRRKEGEPWRCKLEERDEEWAAAEEREEREAEWLAEGHEQEQHRVRQATSVLEGKGGEGQAEGQLREGQVAVEVE